MKIKRYISVSVFTVLLTVLNSSADVRLASIFADHMVLQQSSEVTLWGWADPGEEVSVKGSWASCADASAVAAIDGTWRLKVHTPQAGGPFALVIRGSNEVVLQDVLIGEVWLCSGQSNMQLSTNDAEIEGTKQAIATADYPQIRLCTVSRKKSC